MEEKALAMFEFINAYINLREKKITNLQNEQWYKFLKDISGLEGIKINYQHEDNKPILEGDRLLSVKGQAVIKCPKPDTIFANWLSIGWDNYNYKCEHINELNNKNTEIKEHFEDNKERVAKYEAWKIKRDNWAEKGKIIAKVNDFYGKLRRINETIKNAVVSHKALIESDIEAQRAEIMGKLEKGQVLEGTVKNRSADKNNQ